MGNLLSKKPLHDLNSLPRAATVILAVSCKAKSIKDCIQRKITVHSLDGLERTIEDRVLAKSCFELSQALAKCCDNFLENEEELKRRVNSTEINPTSDTPIMARLLTNLLKERDEIFDGLQTLIDKLSELSPSFENPVKQTNGVLSLLGITWGSADSDSDRTIRQLISYQISSAANELQKFLSEISTKAIPEERTIDFNDTLLQRTLSDALALHHKKYGVSQNNQLTNNFLTSAINLAVVQTIHFEFRGKLDILISNCESIARELKSFPGLRVQRDSLIASSKRCDFKQIPSKRNSDLAIQRMRQSFKKPSENSLSRAKKQMKELSDKYRTLSQKLERLQNCIQEVKDSAVNWREDLLGTAQNTGAKSPDDGDGGLFGRVKQWARTALFGTESTTIRAQGELRAIDSNATGCLNILSSLRFDVNTAAKAVCDIRDSL